MNFGSERQSSHIRPRSQTRAPANSEIKAASIHNVSNFDTPRSPLTAFLDGSVGSINGATPLNRNNRYGLGSGSFAPGIPRALQFGIRVGF
jgi:hypothetical protein